MRQIFKHFTLLGFDRSFSKGLVSQLVWLASIMCIVFIVLAGISYVGEMYVEDGSRDNRFLDILLVLIDPGVGSEAMSSTLTIVCSLLGLTVFGGMLISVICNVLERRVESYTKGEAKYKISDHVVILGFNRSIPSLINHILTKYQEEDPYVLIMCNRDVEERRDWLLANIPNHYEDNIVFMNGVRNTTDDIDRLRLKYGVKEIYILGEEDEPAHDAISMECARNIAQKLNEDGINDKIKCHVQLDSQVMFSALQKAEIDKTIKERLIFLPFNFNEIWAQKALATIPNKEYKSLDGAGITEGCNKNVHFIIVGVNPLSCSLAINAAQILHFPNYKEGVFETCSTITFIDSEAMLKGQEFRSRYRNLFDLARWREVDENQCMDTDSYWIDPVADENSDSPYKYLGPTNFMDIQWEFVKGNVFDKHVQKYIESIVNRKDTITTIALCEEESDKNASICMALSEVTRLKANEILVRQNDSDIVIETLRKTYSFENIRAFGMMNECYSENLISDKYGKLVNAWYGDYSTGQRVEVDIRNAETVEVLWDKCTTLNRWSSIYSANMLFYKIRSIGLNVSTDLDNRLTKEQISNAIATHMSDLVRVEHNRWNTEKLILGFRPLFNDEVHEWIKNKKLMKEQLKHRAIMPFDMLSKEEQNKDNDVNQQLFCLYDEIVKKTLNYE